MINMGKFVGEVKLNILKWVRDMRIDKTFGISCLYAKMPKEVEEIIVGESVLEEAIKFVGTLSIKMIF